MHDPLRLRRCAARVEQVEQLFGGHRIGRALGRLTWYELVPPVVATSLHRCCAGGAWLATLVDQNARDGWAALERLVGDRLQLKEVSLAVATVSGDQHLRGGVVDPVGERIRGETAEDHAVCCAEAGAGEHGDCDFRDHRHVDGNAVALGHAERLQRVRGLLHLAQQVVVGNGAAVTWLADPVEGHLIATTGGNVAIDAVLRNVELTVIEPLRKWELPLQRFREGLSPGEELACLLGPEGNRVGAGTPIEIGARICRCGC